MVGAAGEAIVSSNRQSCVRWATRPSPMAASNHVLCLCRRTRCPRTPGSLQRSPLPGPGPPLSLSPRGTQRCILRRYCRCRCCFLPTPQSHTRTTAPASASRRRQRRRVCPVAVAVFARRGRGDPSPQLLQCGQGARRFRRAGLACAPRDEVPASAVVTVVCRRQRRQQGQRRRLSKEGRERRDNALKLVRDRGHGRGAEAERRAPLVSLSSPEGVSRDCLFWRSVSFVF